MNFNQKPGFYDAKTDKLIMNIKKAEEEKYLFLYTDTHGIGLTIRFQNVDFSEPFYIILPDSVIFLYGSDFIDSNIAGISGQNVCHILSQSFFNCPKLEKVDLPNLLTIPKNCFAKCPLLEEQFTKDGLFILNDKYLINANNYLKDELVISNNIEAIAADALLDNKFIRTIKFPLKFRDCSLYLNDAVKTLVLPIDFQISDEFIRNSVSQRIYKGSKEQLDKLIHERIIKHPDNIIFEPFTKEELQKSNYSLKDIETILGKKLTLDEILEYNYSIKEANDYFKGDVYEL